MDRQFVPLCAFVHTEGVDFILGHAPVKQGA